MIGTTRRIFAGCVALPLAPQATLHGADSPLPLVPVGGSVTYPPHPHFKWQREADVTLDEVHRIQIARDAAFADVECDDRLELNPLVPERTWDYFCLDRVPYHGRTPCIFLDKTGNRYGKVAGLRVLAGGTEIAAADILKQITRKLR